MIMIINLQNSAEKLVLHEIQVYKNGFKGIKKNFQTGKNSLPLSKIPYLTITKQSISK